MFGIPDVNWVNEYIYDLKNSEAQEKDKINTPET